MYFMGYELENLTFIKDAFLQLLPARQLVVHKELINQKAHN